ncbi:putative pentatricopeptide repeat-containing protein At1g12700, mitochondrial [Olea europaea var. sylvestris]|uniref:putative pentatricopeptide repeat-containing protein At1g12700, mitochondrial n=1 Tax=Olea europaea var. sylvestris TaxID=158386 RepID=UPI000C1D1162|nr:putative pentatricopeptide repeat-containing protein At1g12700, mitochondrial [Olea europaea var. sylvestris]
MVAIKKASILVFWICACIYVCVLPSAAEMVSRTAQRCKLSPTFIHTLKSKSPTQFETETPRKNFKRDCKIDTNDALTRFYNNMLKMKPMPPIWSFNKLLGSVAKTKNYQDVIIMYRRIVEVDVLPDTCTLNILLNCYCSLKSVALGFAVMGGIIKRGYSPDMFTYNTLIKGLCMEDKIDDTVTFFNKIVQMGFLPDVTTWAILTNGLCKSGNTEIALQLVKEVGGSNGRFGLTFTPNLIIYSTLIHGLCKEGLLEKGKLLFLEMKGRGIMPDLFTYSALIHGLCEAGGWDEAKQFFIEMIDQGIRPNVILFNILIDALYKEGKTKEANGLLNLMIQRGEEPSSATYNILMNGLCLDNRIDDARELFVLMEAKGHKRDVVSYNVLIGGYCRCQKLEEAMRLFKEMVHKDYKPNVITFNTLLIGLFKAGRVEEAREHFAKTKFHEVIPNSASYDVLLNGFVINNCLMDAMEIIHTLERSGVNLGIETYNCVLDGLCKAGELDLACELFGKLSYKDVITYNIMIHCFSKHGNMEQMYEAHIGKRYEMAQKLIVTLYYEAWNMVSHQKQYVETPLMTLEESAQIYEKTKQQDYGSYRSRSPCSSQSTTQSYICRSLDEGFMPESSYSRPTEPQKDKAEVLRDEEAIISVNLRKIFVKN